MSLPWNEKVSMLSINPDSATREDIAKMASELMEKSAEIERLTKLVEEAYRTGYRDGESKSLFGWQQFCKQNSITQE